GDIFARWKRATVGRTAADEHAAVAKRLSMDLVADDFEEEVLFRDGVIFEDEIAVEAAAERVFAVRKDRLGAEMRAGKNLEHQPFRHASFRAPHSLALIIAQKEFCATLSIRDKIFLLKSPQRRLGGILSRFADDLQSTSLAAVFGLEDSMSSIGFSP